MTFVSSEVFDLKPTNLAVDVAIEVWGAHAMPARLGLSAPQGSREHRNASRKYYD
jgi:hypothetical protein